jgi:hypothetical protein
MNDDMTPLLANLARSRKSQRRMDRTETPQSLCPHKITPIIVAYLLDDWGALADLAVEIVSKF